MSAFTRRGALALSCLVLALAATPAQATTPAKPATGKVRPDAPQSEEEVRQRFAQRMEALQQKERGFAEQTRREAQACPTGKARRQCLQDALKRRHARDAELKRERIAARRDQEMALAPITLRNELRQLEERPASGEFKAAKRRQLEAEAQLRRELADIQADAGLGRLECDTGVCRQAVANAAKVREDQARKRLDIERLQKETRRLHRDATQTTTAEAKPPS